MPHSTYLPERMGSATIDPAGSFEAGSFQSFTLTCTAGYFGIDDYVELPVSPEIAIVPAPTGASTTRST